MTERLVDIADDKGKRIHTYPVTLPDNGSHQDDTAFKEKALEAAANGRLVSDEKLPGLSASMHVSRRGALAPYGDEVKTDSETHVGLEDALRERAYFLWENNGRPDGEADRFWKLAHDETTAERSHVLWEQDGSHPDQSDKNWHQVEEFERA